MEVNNLPSGEYTVTVSTRNNHSGPFTITASVDNGLFTFEKQEPS